MKPVLLSICILLLLLGIAEASCDSAVEIAKRNHVNLNFSQNENQYGKASGIAYSTHRVISCAHAFYDHRKQEMLEVTREGDLPTAEIPLLIGVTITSTDTSIGPGAMIAIDKEHDFAIIEFPSAHFHPTIIFAKESKARDTLFAYTYSYGTPDFYQEFKIGAFDSDGIIIAPGINPGASGAGFYNKKGELVGMGIGTRGGVGSGISFLQPSALVREFILKNPEAKK